MKTCLDAQLWLERFEENNGLDSFEIEAIFEQINDNGLDIFNDDNLILSGDEIKMIKEAAYSKID